MSPHPSARLALTLPPGPVLAWYSSSLLGSLCAKAAPGTFQPVSPLASHPFPVPTPLSAPLQPRKGTWTLLGRSPGVFCEPRQRAQPCQQASPPSLSHCTAPPGLGAPCPGKHRACPCLGRAARTSPRSPASTPQPAGDRGELPPPILNIYIGRASPARAVHWRQMPAPQRHEGWGGDPDGPLPGLLSHHLSKNYCATVLPHPSLPPKTLPWGLALGTASPLPSRAAPVPPSSPRLPRRGEAPAGAQPRGAGLPPSPPSQQLAGFLSADTGCCSNECAAPSSPSPAPGEEGREGEAGSHQARREQEHPE